jgi:hypothetical protein
MEREWDGALGNGNKVSVKIEVDWPSGASRPSGFDVTYTVTNQQGVGKTYIKAFKNP